MGMFGSPDKLVIDKCNEMHWNLVKMTMSVMAQDNVSIVLKNQPNNLVINK